MDTDPGHDIPPVDPLGELDFAQRKAVLHEAGPLLLVAGAGSGKTRAIVARIARLIRDGVPPKRIVGITFTNRAAEEMRERVARAFPAAHGDLPWLGTFHAFGATLLRRFGARIGVPPGFLIYDARDQMDVVRQILKDLNIDEKKFPAGRFADVIERAKRTGSSIETAALAAGWLFAGKSEAVYKAYEEALSSAGAVDFADLIRLPVALLRGAPDALGTVRSEVRHLLVDEFQDVDAGQAALTGLIATGADSFCAVGDEDQSIYGWRGGSAGPMLSFERDYPGATVLTLGTNYRTRASILSAAEAVIRKNRARRDKRISAARDGGEKPEIVVREDADAEALEVAGQAGRVIKAGVRPSDVAVFYRVNAQSRAVEDALRLASIPYVLRGALSFYDRAVVRDALAYLKWALHPDDLLMLKRLLAAPRRGVGDAAVAKAREAAKRAGAPVSAELAKLPALKTLFDARSRWLARLPEWSPGEALRFLLAETGYLAWLAARDPERFKPGRVEDQENVEELFRLADAAQGSGEEAARIFLERASLSGADTGENGGEAVRLMTLHNAKGLEFSVVFLVGVEEGLLPHSRSGDSETEIEEERRLFYVGLTRARDRAFLSLARRRLLFGALRDSIPSRFLSEIPPELVAWPERGLTPRRPAIPGTHPPPQGAPGSKRREPEEAHPQRPRRVRHPLFGEGRIESVDGEGKDMKIIARFPGYGVKKILVRAASMEIFD